MRGRRTGQRGEGGSVLMEGILVLPLYLTMLGALFIMGDLERARNSLLAVERSLTWLASDRFEGHDRPGMLRMLAAFEDKETAPVVSYRVVEMKEGNRRAGNTWLDAFAGYALMHVKVPIWMRVANTGATTWNRVSENGGKEMPFREKYTVPARDGGGADRQFRSFVVRRRRFDAGKHYDRSKDGSWMAGDVWVNVTENEPWVTGVERGFHKMPEPRTLGNMAPYIRLMAAWGE